MEKRFKEKRTKLGVLQDVLSGWDEEAYDKILDEERTVAAHGYYLDVMQGDDYEYCVKEEPYVGNYKHNRAQNALLAFNEGYRNRIKALTQEEWLAAKIAPMVKALEELWQLINKRERREG